MKEWLVRQIINKLLFELNKLGMLLPMQKRKSN
jgi:hypothetical protein